MASLAVLIDRTFDFTGLRVQLIDLIRKLLHLLRTPENGQFLIRYNQLAEVFHLGDNPNDVDPSTSSTIVPVFRTRAAVSTVFVGSSVFD